MELISKEALLKQIEEDSEELGRGYYGDEWKWMDTINNMPTIESRPTGKWMKIKSPKWAVDEYKCSICHYDEGCITWDYCPNCGAEMEGE